MQVVFSPGAEIKFEGANNFVSWAATAQRMGGR